MSHHATLLKNSQEAILADWTAKLEAGASRLNQVTTRDERAKLSRELLDGLIAAAQAGDLSDVEGDHFERARRTLNTVSIDFAERGLTPSETAGYVFSLKESIFEVYQRELPTAEFARAIWDVSQGLDRLGLFTFETFSLARERIIKSQAQALTELSTPVIQVWEGIIALPLVGSIDSIRAKEIMEKLLEAVVAQQADVVIIDITGVPVVDTQVANRLMRTVEAVRLLGTSSIITGINPVIAQTLVQLGVDLSQLSTKSSLRAGLQQAFKDMRIKVSRAEGKR